MIRIIKKEIPEFLQNGHLYSQLQEGNGDDENEFSIPIHKYKNDTIVE